MKKLLIAIVLSLVTVANAATGVDNSGNVTLKIELDGDIKELVAAHAEELTYRVSLAPEDGTMIGAAQFTLTCPAGTTFTKKVINKDIIYSGDTTTGSLNGIFELGLFTGADGSLGGNFNSDKTAFSAVLAGTVSPGSVKDGKELPTRMLTSEAWIYTFTVSVPGGVQENVDYTLGVSADPSVGWDDQQGGISHRYTVTLDNPTVKYSGDSFMLGDVNGDKMVNHIDAAMVYAYYNNKLKLTDEQLVAANVNGDSVVNHIDAAMIYAYYNNKIAKFPAEK